MNLRNYVVGGLAALALGGCGRELKELKKDARLGYSFQGNGMLVPDLKGFRETKWKFRIVNENSCVGVSYFDRNYGNGLSDLAMVEVYKKDDTLYTGPSERYLIVDTHSDTHSISTGNSADIVFVDFYGPDKNKADGNYDVAMDALVLYKKLTGEHLDRSDRLLSYFTAKIVNALVDELRLSESGVKP